MTSPMRSAYCTTPMGDAYCRMPPVAVIRAKPAAAHTHTSAAGIGDFDMASFSAVLLVAILGLRWRKRKKWAAQ